jgi:hypothetical protein
VIRVSEENDRKLWRLIFKEKWSGTCLDPYTYVFTMDQLQRIKKAGIVFEEIKPKQTQESQAKRASGARRR